MKNRMFICCDCGASIYQGDDCYAIDGAIYCESCGQDELDLRYKKNADYPEELYESRREELT